jgi:hypothetical protein
MKGQRKLACHGEAEKVSKRKRVAKETEQPVSQSRSSRPQRADSGGTRTSIVPFEKEKSCVSPYPHKQGHTNRAIIHNPKNHPYFCCLSIPLRGAATAAAAAAAVATISLCRRLFFLSCTSLSKATSLHSSTTKPPTGTTKGHARQA